MHNRNLQMITIAHTMLVLDSRIDLQSSMSLGNREHRQAEVIVAINMQLTMFIYIDFAVFGSDHLRIC